MPDIGKLGDNEDDELGAAAGLLGALDVNTSDPRNRYPIASPATRQTRPSVYAWVVVHRADFVGGWGLVLCELAILCFDS
jgi:hypothetical protein